MFTKKEKRLIGEGDITIIRETERYIEVLSNNTKHCWIICKNQDSTDRPIMIYHKHSRKTEYYHRLWKPGGKHRERKLECRRDEEPLPDDADIRYGEVAV